MKKATWPISDKAVMKSTASLLTFFVAQLLIGRSLPSPGRSVFSRSHSWQVLHLDQRYYIAARTAVMSLTGRNSTLLEITSPFLPNLLQTLEKKCPFGRTNDFAYQDENVCCKHVTGTLPTEDTSGNHAVPVSASLLPMSGAILV